MGARNSVRGEKWINKLFHFVWILWHFKKADPENKKDKPVKNGSWMEMKIVSIDFHFVMSNGAPNTKIIFIKSRFCVIKSLYTLSRQRLFLIFNYWHCPGVNPYSKRTGRRSLLKIIIIIIITSSICIKGDGERKPLKVRDINSHTMWIVYRTSFIPL